MVNSCGILHTQGGWPKDVDATDVEHTIRYRKKIEKDEEYMRVIKSLGDVRPLSKSRLTVTINLTQPRRLEHGTYHQAKQRHRHLSRVFPRFK